MAVNGVDVCPEDPRIAFAWRRKGKASRSYQAVHAETGEPLTEWGSNQDLLFWAAEEKLAARDRGDQIRSCLSCRLDFIGSRNARICAHCGGSGSVPIRYMERKTAQRARAKAQGRAR